MPISMLFWLIFVVVVLFYGWAARPFNRQSGAGFAILVLIFLLGWRAFGFILTN